jgi:hypothetical protein
MLPHSFIRGAFTAARSCTRQALHAKQVPSSIRNAPALYKHRVASTKTTSLSLSTRVCGSISRMQQFHSGSGSGSGSGSRSHSTFRGAYPIGAGVALGISLLGTTIAAAESKESAGSQQNYVSPPWPEFNQKTPAWQVDSLALWDEEQIERGLDLLKQLFAVVNIQWEADPDKLRHLLAQLTVSSTKSDIETEDIEWLVQFLAAVKEGQDHFAERATIEKKFSFNGESRNIDVPMEEEPLVSYIVNRVTGHIMDQRTPVEHQSDKDYGNLSYQPVNSVDYYR